MFMPPRSMVALVWTYPNVPCVSVVSPCHGPTLSKGVSGKLDMANLVTTMSQSCSGRAAHQKGQNPILGPSILRTFSTHSNQMTSSIFSCSQGAQVCQMIKPISFNPSVKSIRHGQVHYIHIEYCCSLVQALKDAQVCWLLGQFLRAHLLRVHTLDKCAKRWAVFGQSSPSLPRDELHLVCWAHAWLPKVVVGLRWVSRMINSYTNSYTQGMRKCIMFI